MGLLGTVESFGKAVWNEGKEVVGAVGDVTAVVDGVRAAGDFVERIGDKADIAKLVEVGEQLAGWAERVGLTRILRAADSPILDGGQIAIAGMRLTTGVGTPDAGERFGQGASRFRQAAGTLSSANPTDGWAGQAAGAYTRQNGRQQATATALAAADHDVHRVIATEAYQINFHRDRLDGWSNWLADVGLVTFALGLIPEVGQAAKEAAELTAVMTALGSSSLELYQLSSEVDANTSALQQLVGRYGSVPQPTGADDAAPPTPPRSPTGGKSDEPPNDTAPDEPSKPPPDEQADTPSSSGAPIPMRPRGAGTGSGSSGGDAIPATAMPIQQNAPAVQAPSRPQAARATTPAPSSVPASMAGAPAAMGAMPMASPSTASSIPMGLINQAVQAAVEKALEKAAEERDEDEDQEPDDEADDAEDKDGDGKPDEPADVSNRAPPDTPIAARLDRESSTEPTPAPAH